MRILCICYEYPPIGGGGATVCADLAQELAARGHEIDVVTSGMRGLPKLETRAGVRIHRVPCLRRHRHHSNAFELLTQIPSSYVRARGLIRNGVYDVIHCHFVVPSGVVAWRLHRRFGLPYLLTAHGSDVPGFNTERFGVLHRLIRPIWRRIMRDASCIAVPSEFLRELIHAQVKLPVEVVPNSVLRYLGRSRARKNRVLVAARIVERKGVQHLVEAAADLDAGWEICVAGDGPYLPAVRELARQKGGRVRFTGFLPREELQKLYLSSKIFVFPSLRENMPMVLLEAMSAGCAVITTNVSGCAETAGDAAVLVEPADPDALREALRTLMADETEIERLGLLGIERAASFETPVIAARYLELFAACAGRPGSSQT